MRLDAGRHPLSRAEILRNALRSSTGDSALDAFFNSQIAVGIDGDPELESVYREETAPEQVELDLHLAGAGVDGHATSAPHFTNFVQQLSRAVKFAARHVANASAWSENLLIEGAGQGSVRLVLRAPDKKRPHPEHGVIPGIVDSTPDSVALRTVASILTFASTSEDSIDSTLLVGAVHELPPEAQQHLRRAVNEVISARWDIEGHVRQRWCQEESVRLTSRGAERLHAALKLNPAPPETERLVGTLDGLKHSLATVYFKVDGQGHALAASVPDERLLLQAAKLVDDPHRQVRAVFTVYAAGSDDADLWRKSRVLRSLIPIANADHEQPALILD